jgi:hypothetical protein
MSMRHTVPAIPPSLPPLLCSPQANPNTVLQGIAKASLLSVFPSQVTRISTLQGGSYYRLNVLLNKTRIVTTKERLQYSPECSNTQRQPVQSSCKNPLASSSDSTSWLHVSNRIFLGKKPLVPLWNQIKTRRVSCRRPILHAFCLLPCSINQTIQTKVLYWKLLQTNKQTNPSMQYPNPKFLL